MPTPTPSERAIVRAPAATRAFTEWSTDDLRVAEALVNGGSLQRAADLCWALLGDGRVRAALETRVKGLLRLPLTWEESGDGRSSGRVSRALEGGDFYAAHSEAALASLCLWGILLGIGICQRVWVRRNGREIGVLRPYDARNLRWDTQRRVWTVRTETGEVDILPGDRRWILYAPSCSGDPDGDERPWMYGAWRACAKPWLGKDFAWGDWQHFGEVHASGIRTADIDPDKPLDKPARVDLANQLADLGGNSACVPPAGVKLRLLEAVARGWETFKESIAAAATEVVVAITGQASSTEVAAGQDTGATLHGKVRQDLIDGDAATLSTCIRGQSLVDYADINFGSEELAPWPKWRTEPPVNVGARGDALGKLAAGITAMDALLRADGQRVVRQPLLEAAGVAVEDLPESAPGAPPPALPVAPSPAP